MELKDLIRNRRRALGLTLDDIAQKVGVSKATVQRWESGAIENLRRDKISKLANSLQTTPGALMGWDGEGDIFQFTNILTPNHRSFSFKEAEGDCKIELTTSLLADFCLCMQDDSMSNSGFQKDDIIFIRQQNSVKDGELAAVKLNDQVTIRRIYMIGETMQFHPDNPNYKPLILTIADPNIRILGKAIAFQRTI